MKPRIALVAIVLATLVVGAWACLGPEERIAFLLYDDAYYYLGVAKHLAEGEGSTFDGINATNGYHPLWCWLLVPLFWIVDDPGVATRVVGLLWFGLAALSAFLLAWALRPRSGEWGAVAAAGLFALHPTLMLRLARPNGLETPLYAVLLALFIGVWERAHAQGPVPIRRFAALGLLLGALILSRLDAGMFAIAAAALLLARRPPSVKETIVLAAASSALVLPVLGWNAVRFGSPMPISERAVQVYAGAERSAMGGPASPAFWGDRLEVALAELPAQLAREAGGGWSALDPVWRAAWPTGLLTLAVAGTVVVAALRLRRRHGALAGDAFGLLATGCLVHYLVYGAWFWVGGEREFRLYYFMPEGMVVAAAVGTLLGRARVPVVVGALALYGVAAMAVGMGRIAEAPSDPGPLAERRQFGWIRRNLPPEAVLATTDAGLVGFFCGRPVVNLDGLINDERFLEALATGRRDRYVADSPVTHLYAGEGALRGWSPAGPEGPPEQHDWMGTLLYEVHHLPGTKLREAGRVEGWLVFEIVRER